MRAGLFPAAVAMALAGSPAAGLADEPLPPPDTRTVCSPTGVYCARMDAQSRTTEVYRKAAPGRVLWRMKGWFRVAALADDGDHFVTGYDGMNLVPRDYDMAEAMLTFHRRVETVGTIRLRDLISVPDLLLHRTASHYYWGDYLGFDEHGHYTVKSSDGRHFAFDVTTGERVH